LPDRGGRRAAGAPHVRLAKWGSAPKGPLGPIPKVQGSAMPSIRSQRTTILPNSWLRSSTYWPGSTFVIAPPIVWPFTYSVTPRLLANAALIASSRPFGRSAADADRAEAARTTITRNDFMTHLFGDRRAVWWCDERYGNP